MSTVRVRRSIPYALWILCQCSSTLLLLVGAGAQPCGLLPPALRTVPGTETARNAKEPLRPAPPLHPWAWIHSLRAITGDESERLLGSGSAALGCPILASPLMWRRRFKTTTCCRQRLRPWCFPLQRPSFCPLPSPSPASTVEAPRSPAPAPPSNSAAPPVAVDSLAASSAIMQAGMPLSTFGLCRLYLRYLITHHHLRPRAARPVHLAPDRAGHPLPSPNSAAR